MDQKNSGLIPFRQKIFYGFGGAAESIMGGIIFVLAYKIYNIEFGVDAGLVGLALAIPRFWDGISDPIMGMISDHTKSRWGRRRPYMFFGAIFTGVLCMMMWSPPATLGTTGLFWYLLLFSIVFFAGYTVFCIPYVAMGFEYTNNYNERTSILGYKIFFTSFINCVLMSVAYPLCFYKPLGETPVQAVRNVGIIYGGFIIVFGLVPAIFCRTPKNLTISSRPSANILEDIKSTFSNKPLMLVCVAGLIMVMAAYVVGPLMTYVNLSYVCSGDKALMAKIEMVVMIVFGVSGFVCVPLVTQLSRIIGKRLTVLLALAAMIVTYAGSWFFITPRYPYLQVIYALVVSPSLSTFFVVGTSMTVDACDYDEYRTGHRREGVFASFSTFITKTSLAFAVGINGFLIKFSGFVVNGAEQTPRTVFSLRLMYALIPVVLLSISLILILCYPLSKQKVLEIQEILKERKQRNQSLQ